LIVLDTDMLSEMMRPESDPTVAAWFSARAATGLLTTTMTTASRSSLPPDEEAAFRRCLGQATV
jgi:predicted nucleic acid-binding protein